MWAVGRQVLESVSVAQEGDSGLDQGGVSVGGEKWMDWGYSLRASQQNLLTDSR